AEADLNLMSAVEVGDADRFNTLRVFAYLRSNIIFRIAKHDPELALSFLRSTRPPEDANFPEELRSDSRIESQLAREVSKKNPQLALKLARESLASGFSFELLSALQELREKDKEAAASLYSAIVDK